MVGPDRHHPRGADPILHPRAGRLVEIDERVPMLRLSCHWFEDAGFLQSQKYEIEVAAGRLVLRAA